MDDNRTQDGQTRLEAPALGSLWERGPGHRGVVVFVGPVTFHGAETWTETCVHTNRDGTPWPLVRWHTDWHRVDN